MKCQHLPTDARKHKQIAATELPDFLGCILNRCLVLRGHQGTNVWQVCNQTRGSRQRRLSQLLKTLIVADGVVQILANRFPNLLFHAIAHHQQRRAGQPCGDGQ